MFTVDEKIRMEDWPDVLLEHWSDEGRRSPGWGQKPLAADFSRRLSEPAADGCEPNAYGQQVENNLTVQLNPQRRTDAASALGVAVRWGRSVPGKCPYRNSVRNVELDETIALAEGQTVNLSGDGELTIRLHRR